MAEDEREEAMRRAVEEADEAEKEHGSSSGGEDGGNPLSNIIGKIVEYLKKVPGFVKGLWDTRNGKIGICAVAGVVVLFVVIQAVAGIVGSGVKEDPVVSCEIGNGLLCMYESPTSTTGYSYDAYVEVKNTGNTNIYLKDMMFQISDSSGNEVMRDSNVKMVPAVIAPGETGYVYNIFGTEVSGISDPNDTYNLRPAFSIHVSESNPSEYAVSDVRSGSSDLGLTLSMTVSNDSKADAYDVYVMALTYNADGWLTGISSVRAGDIEAGSSKYVEISPLNMVRGWKYDPVADYRVYAY